MTSFLALCITQITGFFASLKLVAWSFFGVRKKRDLERDFTQHPLQVLIAAIFCLIVFVMILGALVRVALRTWT